jgi:hypothetical protein
MAKIGTNISVSGYTGKLLIVWREVIPGDPTPPETGRSDAFDFPYDDIYVITNINPVVHLLELWRSDDGVQLHELIKRWEIDASLYNEISSVTYQYKVDRGETEGTPGDGTFWADPVDLDTELVDERLNGATKNQLVVHKAGYGNLLNSEYELRTDSEGIILSDGARFDTEVPWFITHSRIATASSGSAGPAISNTTLFSGIEVVIANQDFDDAIKSLLNKLVICNKAGAVLTITFPDFGLIPNNTHVTFNTHNGSQNYTTLQFDTGDSVLFLNQNKNVIYLAPGETISIYWHGGVAHIYQYSGRALYRGSVWADMDSARHTNTKAYLLADESTGELNLSDYPGLSEFIQDLPVGHSVPLGTLSTQWSYENLSDNTFPNKSKWGIDLGTGKFRVPHLKDLVRRFVSTSQNPGYFEKDVVGPISLEVHNGQGGNSANPLNGGNTGNTGFAGMDNFGSWLANGASGSELWIRTAGGATQNKVRTYGEKPFIIL